MPDSLSEFVTGNTRCFVLTGAGVSTASGLGDYRDGNGQWKRKQPITGQTFTSDEMARKRYWARSAVGWPIFSNAKPNVAHQALRTLQQQGVVQSLVTQNVDELHQQAGHTDVIDLHGVLSTVSCIQCGHKVCRHDFQQHLLDQNPWLSTLSAAHAPDGDADLESSLIESMHVPACTACNGILKPDVVFFGENVPGVIVERAMHELRQSDVLLVAGSSLMVFSGYRFCRDAARRGQPIIIINRGVTRADELATWKLDADCGAALAEFAATGSSQDIATGSCNHVE